MLSSQKTYDDLSAEYEARVPILANSTKALIHRFVPFITTGRNVLDIGCAVGHAMSIFRQGGFIVDGVEFSEPMATFAKKRNPVSKIFIGDFRTVRFSRQYDAVFAHAFIHLFPSRELPKILRKIRQLLKPHGALFVSSTYSTRNSEGWESKNDFPGSGKRYRRHFTKQEFLNVLSENGFTIVDFYLASDPLQKKWMIATAR